MKRKTCSREIRRLDLEIGRRQEHVLFVGEVADEWQLHGMARIESWLAYDEVELHERRRTDIDGDASYWGTARPGETSRS